MRRKTGLAAILALLSVTVVCAAAWATQFRSGSVVNVRDAEILDDVIAGFEGQRSEGLDRSLLLCDPTGRSATEHEIGVGRRRIDAVRRGGRDALGTYPN